VSLTLSEEVIASRNPNELQVVMWNVDASNHSAWERLATPNQIDSAATSLEFYLIPPTSDRTTDMNLDGNVVLGNRPPRTLEYIPNNAIPEMTAGTCGAQSAATEA